MSDVCPHCHQKQCACDDPASFVGTSSLRFDHRPSNERINPSDDQVRALMERYNFRHPIVSDLAHLIRDAWKEGQRFADPMPRYQCHVPGCPSDHISKRQVCSALEPSAVPIKFEGAPELVARIYHGDEVIVDSKSLLDLIRRLSQPPCSVDAKEHARDVHYQLIECFNLKDTPTANYAVRRMLETLAARPSQPPTVTLPDAVLNVAELLHTQDNRITANPIFAVEVKKRIYGIDPEWGGPVVWLHDGEEVTDAEEIKQLEEGWENGDDEPDNHTRTSYYEYWEFVTACFTEEGCKAYLRRNGHNHRGEKRIYAHGGFRNNEWEELRKYLMSLRPALTKE